MIMEIRASPPSWIIWTIEAIATTHKQGIVHQLNFDFLTFASDFETSPFEIIISATFSFSINTGSISYVS